MLHDSPKNTFVRKGVVCAFFLFMMFSAKKQKRGCEAQDCIILFFTVSLYSVLFFPLPIGIRFMRVFIPCVLPDRTGKQGVKASRQRNRTLQNEGSHLTSFWKQTSARDETESIRLREQAQPDARSEEAHV